MRVVIGCLVLLSTLCVISAQQPDATLDVDDKLALTMLAALNERARTDCNALDSSKTYQAMRARVEARLKAKHGLTVDQAVAQLTEKK